MSQDCYLAYVLYPLVAPLPHIYLVIIQHDLQNIPQCSIFERSTWSFIFAIVRACFLLLLRLHWQLPHLRTTLRPAVMAPLTFPQP
ncbi:hypothetical protein BC826DRAFT_1011448 [Russula brevipes]|nr:hypothetical protein BC826DRAFT_1011448 [Russula brevipes]